LTWSQKLSDQLNLAHVARKNEKEKNKRQCPHNSVAYRFKIREGSSVNMSGMTKYNRVNRQ